MIRKLLASMVLALVAGCAVAPAEEGTGASVDAPSKETAASVVQSDAVANNPSILCPSSVTCSHAQSLCKDPEVDVYWCSIWDQCADCPIWQEGVKADAPVEASATSCPPAGTCDKADDLCIDEVRTPYWCSIWSRCVDCME
jgi:hypothetical protein